MAYMHDILWSIYSLLEDNYPKENKHLQIIKNKLSSSWSITEVIEITDLPGQEKPIFIELTTGIIYKLDSVGKGLLPCGNIIDNMLCIENSRTEIKEQSSSDAEDIFVIGPF